MEGFSDPRGYFIGAITSPQDSMQTSGHPPEPYPRPGCSSGLVQPPVRVNVRWVTPLGEAVAWLPLGNFYADEMRDDEAAEEAYRGGIAAGEAYCHHNLAVLLAERGDFDGAVEQFRLGAAAGDQLAADALRELEHG